MSEERQVRVTGADILSVGEKLAHFQESLPPEQQAVMRWLLQRAEAATGEQDEVSGYGFGFPPTVSPGGLPGGTTFRSGLVNTQLNSALGMQQLNHVSPGQTVAISGTVGIRVSF